MIVITGAGVVSAIGLGKEATLAALKQHRTGIGEVKYLTTTHHEIPVGEVKMSNAEMQALVEVPADQGQPLSRTALMGRLALREALQQASLADATELLAQTPLISGTTVAGMDRAEVSLLAAQATDGDYSVASPLAQSLRQSMLSSQSDCGSNTEEIARGFGQFALLDTLSTACSSAANAFIVGANLIRSGQYQRVIVGGTESLSRLHLNGFNTLMILDRELCRPFDATRAGLNLGEGAAYLVLETDESALARGVQPLATLSGYGNACDAFHQTASSDNGEGAYLAMHQAITMAGLQPADIDYINAHGTGTPNNDPSELKAMHRLFAALPPFSSTKGFTGHTTSASGSIEAVFCLMALQQQFLPVSLHWSQAIPDEASPVSTDTKPVRPLRHILCNAFGFGGNDSSLLLSAYEPETEKADADEEQKSPDGMRHTAEEKQKAPDDMRGATDEKREIPVYILAHNTLPQDSDPDFKQYMKPGDARRLGRLLKRTLALSLQTMHDGGIAQPDAIITATVWGSMESSEKFLLDMLANGEEMLQPTNFMQSTHNTLSSLIAIQTQNHGYNNTHSQGASSLQCALRDAWTQMQLGQIRTALVGLHDSLPTMHNEALLLATADAIPEGITPIGELKW